MLILTPLHGIVSVSFQINKKIRSEWVDITDNNMVKTEIIGTKIEKKRKVGKNENCPKNRRMYRNAQVPLPQNQTSISNTMRLRIE